MSRGEKKKRLDNALQTLEQIETDTDKEPTPLDVVFRYLAKSGERLTPRDLAPKVNQKPPTTRRNLAQLLSLGLVSVYGSGKDRYYQVTQHNKNNYLTRIENKIKSSL